MENQANPGQEEKQPANTELATITEGKKIVRSDDPNAIFSPEGLKQALTVCQHFMASQALPQSYKTPQAVLMAIQAGRELGMKPIESINGMMVINGQIKLWGTALTGRITQLGYRIKWGDCTAEAANVSVVDPNGNETGVETYTIEEAKTAGLLGKQNWRGHAKTMLRWRALGNCIKFNFPHLLQGYSLVEDDDNVDQVQGDRVIINQDNASQLLNKKKEDGGVRITDVKNDGTVTMARGEKPAEEPKKPEEPKEESAPVEGEIVDEEKKEEPKEEEKKELTVGDIPDEAGKIRTLMAKAKSKEEAVLQHYGVDKLENMTSNQAIDLCKKLNEKIKTIEEDARGGNHLPPVRPNEGPAAKKMREAAAAKKNQATQLSAKPQEVTQGIPGDVCQYLNAIEGVTDDVLPSDIVMLKLDTNRGQFKGYNAYPSLRDEMARVQLEAGDAPAEVEAAAPPKDDAKPVMLTPEILEVSNELASHDPNDLNDDQKNFILDVNNNKFKGKAAYPGVTF